MSDKNVIMVHPDKDDPDTIRVKAMYVVAYDVSDVEQVGHQQALALAYMNAAKLFIDTAGAIMTEAIQVEVSYSAESEPQEDEEGPKRN